MNINATLVGELLVVFALLLGALSYVLARGKTDNPLAAAVLGGVLGLIPPLGLLYLAALLLKQQGAKADKQA
ncbi:hypothetical protein [Rheinheimera sp.]|uniref:hypothetical protein n=1 Tax=Rheinheimera sp. TaxID=1869214 RepID=UPI00307E0023